MSDMERHDQGISSYDKDGVTYWSCGCKTYGKIEHGKKVLMHESCGNEVCPVLIELHKASNERGTRIEHRKG
jgi:hypothetical protein